MAEASSVFARVPAEEGGRFPLTGRGDVNTYALFAELFSTCLRRGRAGVIVPTGSPRMRQPRRSLRTWSTQRLLGAVPFREPRKASFPASTFNEVLFTDDRGAGRLSANRALPSFLADPRI